jgi:hypothetical protein
MARDIRQSPRGLIAPLSQPALASLRSLNDGTPITLPEDQKLRLLELGLIEETADGLLAVTPWDASGLYPPMIQRVIQCAVPGLPSSML